MRSLPRRIAFSVAPFLVPALLVVACSGNNSDSGLFDSSTPTAGSGGSSSPFGHGGSGPGDDDDGGDDAGGTDNGHGGGVIVGQGGGDGVGGGMQCAAVSQTAKQAPLDMLVMMDQSGSMAETTSSKKNAPTKWQAVTSAIASFVGDPSSNGISVGIQFFPLEHAGVPGACGSTSECGDAGPCSPVGLCVDSFFGDVLDVCTPGDAASESTCNQEGGDCQKGGICSGNTDYVCGNPGQKGGCQDDSGMNLGDCENKGACQNKECVIDDYATPAVEIAELPGAAPSINDAMSSHGPTGGTPTTPALTGAVLHAGDWKSQHPDHAVVVVLATDGLPQGCDASNTVDAVAQVAGAGKTNQNIATFVIGVFSKDDGPDAQTNLNEIAQAGSGNNAFIVTTGTNDTDTAMAFLAALNEIRGTAASCDFELNASDGVDYGKVNVDVTPPGGSPSTVLYVESAANCDATTGGWYYDADPATGGTPTKVTLCDATCGSFKNNTGTTVDIAVGCATQVGPIH